MNLASLPSVLDQESVDRRIACSAKRWDELTVIEIDEWQRLALRVDAPPDLYPSWASALVDAHQLSAQDLFVVSLVVDGALSAILPVRIKHCTRNRFPILVAEPLLSIFSLHFSVLAESVSPKVLSSLVHAVSQLVPKIGMIEFNRVSGDGAAFNWLMHEAHGHGYRAFSRQGDTPPFLAIDCAWDAFLQRKSGNFRANIKRKRRKLEERGVVSYSYCRTLDEVGPGLAAIASIEARSWKAADGTSLSSRPWEGRFYECLCSSLAPHGKLLLTILFVDGLPVAYDMSVFSKRVGYCLKTSFDQCLGDLSPGLVLRAEVMRVVFEMGVQEYDFLGKNERYKLEWSETVRQDFSIALFPTSRLAGRLFIGAERLRERLTCWKQYFVGPGSATHS